MQSTDNNLKELTKDLRVLYIEDDRITMVIVGKKLKALFREVIFAEDGIQGLEKFGTHKPDLVLTDNLMPRMNGLDFIRHVRMSDTKTPIILITGYIDTAILVESINLGVTQFVAKPVNHTNLLKAIEIAVQRVIVDNLIQKSREQELELLRYQEKYHSDQQDLAFRKELNIIRNDLFFRSIQPKETLWFLDFHYQPLDIMCGDSYSIREIGDGQVLAFLFDSMGKGISASVTSILSTSFANYIIDKNTHDGSFDFRSFLDTHIGFIKRELLDDEIFCATYALFDFRNNTVDIALFSMPQIIYVTEEGSVNTIKCNNLPIMKYPQAFRVDRYDLSQIRKMIIYSDGLNESNVADEILYQDFLEKDFIESFGIHDLMAHFSQKVKNPGDDITFFYLKKVSREPVWMKSFLINSTASELTSVTEEVESCVSGLGVTDEFLALFINSFTETLMNAYEHGNLGITRKNKHSLIEKGVYDDFLMEKERECDRKITISLSIVRDREEEYLYTTIADEGTGYDTNILKSTGRNTASYNGRGIRITQSMVDEIFCNKKGNEITFVKKMQRRRNGSNDHGNIGTDHIRPHQDH